jgi:hypothetical protein
MSCVYFIRDNSYARELIRGLLGLAGFRVPARHAQQAVNVCDSKLGRYIKAGVGECGCVVIVADTEGQDRPMLSEKSKRTHAGRGSSPRASPHLTPRAPSARSR